MANFDHFGLDRDFNMVAMIVFTPKCPLEGDISLFFVLLSGVCEAFAIERALLRDICIMHDIFDMHQIYILLKN